MFCFCVIRPVSEFGVWDKVENIWDLEDSAENIDGDYSGCGFSV